MGAPEISVGLVPAGGGIKELLARGMAGWDGQSDPSQMIESVFRRIVLDGNSANAHEARKFGLLRPGDGISRNADSLLFDAKSRALELANKGYLPPSNTEILVPGQAAYKHWIAKVGELCRTGVFTEYDRAIAEKVAAILTIRDGDAHRLSEQVLLDLERDTLIAFAHDKRTIARIQSLLETGKPLRN